MLERRAAFYRAESDDLGRDGSFRREEPNLRVYGRMLSANLACARQGLSQHEFNCLLPFLAEEFLQLGGHVPSNEGAKPEPASKGQ